MNTTHPPNSSGDINHRFTYHKPTEDMVPSFETIRGEAKDLAHTIAGLCPAGREVSLALTKLEEAVMWANAAIARASP